MLDLGASTATEDCLWRVELGDRLHDLCQPLTALQCRLEVAAMDREPAAMAIAIEDALRECERLNVKVYAMHAALQRSRGDGENEGRGAR